MIALTTVQQLIKEQGLRWEAGETGLSNLYPDLVETGFFGVTDDQNDEEHISDSILNSDIEDIEESDRVPKINWKEINERSVTTIKDQKNCGACVSFAVCAVAESMLQIQHDISYDLSEAELFFCGAGKNAKGWSLPKALKYAQNKGIGLEKDHAYDTNKKDCLKIDPVVKVGAYIPIKENSRLLSNVISYHGPVAATMRVFEDFRFYKGGIYRPVTNNYLGKHAIAIIGFDDHDSCWIVKNSWSTNWGDNGFARIAYGTCGIGDEFACYALDVELVEKPIV